jgi:KDO2-lipid IV(A) lauroyltransferase
VILGNLERSFPGKSLAELKLILKRYYRNLADITVEIIKWQRIKSEDLLTRFSFTGFEIMQQAFDNGKSVIVAIGHCGNWEWMGTALGQITPVKGYAIIKPLSNKNFHNYLENLRHRLNPDSTIAFRHTYRTLVRNMKDRITFNVFAGDQTPTRSEINYWSTFLHQDTPFFTGIEKIATSLDFTVVYIDIQRIARGRYNGEISLITNEPKKTAENEITEKYIRLLEKSIQNQPDNWLWSHRRWKFNRNGTHV